MQSKSHAHNRSTGIIVVHRTHLTLYLEDALHDTKVSNIFCASHPRSSSQLNQVTIVIASVQQNNGALNLLQLLHFIFLPVFL